MLNTKTASSILVEENNREPSSSSPSSSPSSGYHPTIIVMYSKALVLSALTAFAMATSKVVDKRQLDWEPRLEEGLGEGLEEEVSLL